MKIIQLIKNVAPMWLVKMYGRYKNRHLLHEIDNLELESMGVSEDGFPWVKLRGGLKFFGLPTSELQVDFFRSYKLVQKGIDEECFGVLVEVIDRYMAPRSMPGVLAGKVVRYAPLRDPLNDFELPDVQRIEIAKKFTINSGDTIVDVGAFHGFGTMKMAEQTGPGGRVYAFEADPKSLAILRKNIEENGLGNVFVIDTALSNTTNHNAKFYIDHVPTGNSLRADVLEELGSANMDEAIIKVDTGDNVLRSYGVEHVDHLSVTVNGGEPEVLLGMQGIIDRSDGIRVTTPGWYFRDGKRLDAELRKILQGMGFANVLTGHLGRVIAWK